MAQPTTEGYIPFKGYKTWYKIVGEKEESGKLPLLLLHGGPGACHDYLWSLAAMADTGRRVIFYDQIGCGNSHIDGSKPEMWTVDLYVEEVDAVRKALDTVQFEGPTGMTKIRACDHMALYNFYTGNVKRDASLPDGIGMTDIKAINTETVARSCAEVMKARAGG